MAAGLKISKRDLQSLSKGIVKAIDNSMDDTYKFFKDITPKRSGNARRNTKYRKNQREIIADYAYGERLDNGWSKQAPKGMTEPSLAHFEKELDKNFRKLSNNREL